VVCSKAVHARESWSFGMARSHAVGAAQSRLRDLCVIASEATGVSFIPHLAGSYRELAESIREGEVGLAWMPPIPAIELEEDNLVTPVALPLRQESTSYFSALVTREGRGRAVGDLQGASRKS
jgi:ABC-type phosphate/phosphonate transport system substrate-binding protein